jgi:hypothetical protein
MCVVLKMKNSPKNCAGAWIIFISSSYCSEDSSLLRSSAISIDIQLQAFRRIVVLSKGPWIFPSLYRVTSQKGWVLTSTSVTTLTLSSYSFIYQSPLHFTTDVSLHLNVSLDKRYGSIYSPVVSCLDFSLCRHIDRYISIAPIITFLSHVI